MQLTDEQLHILNALKKGLPLAKVVAFAGSGKTTLLYHIAKHTKGRKLYLAFNKAIELEAREKFVGVNTIVKTTHALAYNFVINRYGYKLKQNYSTMEITHLYSVDYKIAYQAKMILESFCNSAHITFDTSNMTPPKELAMQMFDDMLNKKIDVTHSFYLKKFQIDLALGNTYLPRYDMVLLDEAQDTNDVTLSIFYNIPAIQKVIVGDKHQQIYSFRGSINAISKIQAQIFYLTYSFRFNEKIAFKASNFLRIFKNEQHTIKGCYKSTSIQTTAIIARTNAELILQMKHLIEDDKPFKTVRPPYNIFALALNLRKLLYQEKLDESFRYLNSFYTEFKHLSSAKKHYYDYDILNYIGDVVEDDVEFLSALKVAKIKNLHNIYKHAQEYYTQPSNLYLTTAHTSKGLEFDEVQLCSDFLCYRSIASWFVTNDIISPMQEGYLEYFRTHCKDQKYIDELNLYYVALTRARVKVVDKTDFNYLTQQNAQLNIENAIQELLQKGSNE